MVAEVEIIKVLELPDGMAQINYKIIDNDFILDSRLSKDDPHLHEVCSGTFTCKQSEIQTTLKKEAKDAYNRHTAIEIPLQGERIKVSEL